MVVSISLFLFFLFLGKSLPNPLKWASFYFLKAAAAVDAVTI
jgi:hypothetical protein